MSVSIWDLDEEAVEAVFRAGFDAGFGITGEGWNAEWPFEGGASAGDRVALQNAEDEAWDKYKRERFD